MKVVVIWLQATLVHSLGGTKENSRNSPRFDFFFYKYHNSGVSGKLFLQYRTSLRHIVTYPPAFPAYRVYCMQSDFNTADCSAPEAMRKSLKFLDFCSILRKTWCLSLPSPSSLQDKITHSVRSVWYSLGNYRPLTANCLGSQSHIATDGQ
jgi:hypothetical protein